MRSGRTGRKSIAIAVTLLVGLRLSAQTAGLSGLMFDPSKLAVPNARLVVENAETSATRSPFPIQEACTTSRHFRRGVTASRFRLTVSRPSTRAMSSLKWLNTREHFQIQRIVREDRQPAMKLLIRLLALFSVETARTMRVWGTIALDEGKP